MKAGHVSGGFSRDERANTRPSAVHTPRPSMADLVQDCAEHASVCLVQLNLQQLPHRKWPGPENAIKKLAA